MFSCDKYVPLHTSVFNYLSNFDWLQLFSKKMESIKQKAPKFTDLFKLSSLNAWFTIL